MAKARIVNPELGRRVAKRRLAIGLSASALGRASGISQQNISSIEQGLVKRPGRSYELAMALGTTVEWLLYETGPEVVTPINPMKQVNDLAADLGPERLGAVIQFMKTLKEDAAEKVA